MNRLAQWLNDKRWAANMRRARKWRRGLSPAARYEFDRYFVPSGADGIYSVKIDDLMAAMTAAHRVTRREIMEEERQ